MTVLPLFRKNFFFVSKLLLHLCMQMKSLRLSTRDPLNKLSITVGEDVVCVCVFVFLCECISHLPKISSSLASSLSYKLTCKYCPSSACMTALFLNCNLLVLIFFGNYYFQFWGLRFFRSCERKGKI